MNGNGSGHMDLEYKQLHSHTLSSDITLRAGSGLGATASMFKTDLLGESGMSGTLQVIIVTDRRLRRSKSLI